jgi:hypothetical protein
MPRFPHSRKPADEVGPTRTIKVSNLTCYILDLLVKSNKRKVLFTTILSISPTDMFSNSECVTKKINEPEKHELNSVWLVSTYFTNKTTFLNTKYGPNFNSIIHAM